MASLADSFLEDLDELEDDSENEEQIEEGVEEEKNDATAEMEADFDENILGVVGQNDISSVTSLRTSDRYKDHMRKIGSCLETPRSTAIEGPLSEDPEYRLIIASNTLLAEMDQEILNVFKFATDLYIKKFPGLETMVTNPIDYCKVVERMKNEMDMTLIDLSDLLPSATVMVVSVTGSTTSGAPLSEEDLSQVLKACEEVKGLDDDKRNILSFIESRMTAIAPNVTALVGSEMAAHLVGKAGGLLELANMPSCNLQVLGQNKEQQLGGFSSASTLKHCGIVWHTDLVQRTPGYLQMKAVRVVAAKLTLAARIDSHADTPNGGEGERLRAEVQDKIEKWQEAPKAKTKKALPAPDDVKRKKRGGKRFRNMKEKFAMTDVRKEANRMSFGGTADEYGDSSMGKTFGMLGKTGGGRLRVTNKEQKQAVKKQKRMSSVGRSSATSGLSSSLAFTPVQGLELMNPTAASQRVVDANKKYFADTGFLSAVNRKA